MAHVHISIFWPQSDTRLLLLNYFSYKSFVLLSLFEFCLGVGFLFVASRLLTVRLVSSSTLVSLFRICYYSYKDMQIYGRRFNFTCNNFLLFCINKWRCRLYTGRDLYLYCKTRCVYQFVSHMLDSYYKAQHLSRGML